MPEFLAEWLARITFRFIKFFVLKRSDEVIARRLKLIQRLVYAFTKNEFLKNVIGEAIKIFEEGGKGTEIIRNMIASEDSKYAVAILKSIFRGKR